MHEVAEMLGAWNTFYVMMGSSAGALTGLVFIIITLIRDRNSRSRTTGISTFTTPTVVHFCGVLFTSAVLSAPFRSLVPVAVILGLAGAAGALYVVRIARQTSRMQSYRPDAEDWTWNAVLPFVAYVTLLLGALFLNAAPRSALFAPAAAALLLIFVGIHNAWDVVTFLATGQDQALPDEREPGAAANATSANAAAPSAGPVNAAPANRAGASIPSDLL